MDAWVCAHCALAPSACQCPPPHRLVWAGSLKMMANMSAVQKERHTVTERDRQFLKSIRIDWGE